MYTVPPATTYTAVPLAVQAFLLQRGWSTFYVANRAELYQHYTKYPNMYFEWSEAVSMELVEFMTLGNSRG